MTCEEQKNTIAAFGEYLNKEGLNYLVLAYKSDGSLTCVMSCNEDLPFALATVIDDENGLEEAFGRALVINAEKKGKLIRINDNNQNINEN